MSWISDIELIFSMVRRKFKTSVSQLKNVQCQTLKLFSQSLTSFGTITAIGLIPLWLYLYSSSYAESGIDVPYGPICRTLSILITALFLGIAFRRFSPRIGNGSI